MTQWGLDNLFNPGKRHMDDEKRRLQSTREEVGDASGGRRIDLESGVVAIKVSRPTDVEVDAAEDTELEPALEVEDVPDVALVDDEDAVVAEDEQPEDDDETPTVAAPVVADEPAAEVTPAPAVVEEPEPAPRKRTLSANAWSRRG